MLVSSDEGLLEDNFPADFASSALEALDLAAGRWTASGLGLASAFPAASAPEAYGAPASVPFGSLLAAWLAEPAWIDCELSALGGGSLADCWEANGCGVGGSGGGLVASADRLLSTSAPKLSFPSDASGRAGLGGAV